MMSTQWALSERLMNSELATGVLVEVVERETMKPTKVSIFNPIFPTL